MKRNVISSAYNTATYLYQIQAIMYEKSVAKSFICTRNLSHVKALLHMCGACVITHHSWEDLF